MAFRNHIGRMLALLLAVTLVLATGSAAAEGRRRTRLVVSTPKPQTTPGPEDDEELPSLQDVEGGGLGALQSIFGGNGYSTSTFQATDTSAMPVVIDRVNRPYEYRNFEFASGTELLKVVYPPIYDCDAALIMCGGHNVLIDCGDAAQSYSVVDMLSRLRVKRLDAIIISHPHHDHTDGFPVIAANVKVGAVYSNYGVDFNSHTQDLYRWAAEAGVPVKLYGDGEVFSVGSASLKTYLRVGLNGSTGASAVNNASAVMLLRWKGRTMLFTGDIEPTGQVQLVGNVAAGALKADILKYPHHGVNPVEPVFMDAVKPKLSIITNKDRNKPAQEGLTWRGWPFINTRYGGVVCQTDGNCWLVDRLIDNWRID